MMEQKINYIQENPYAGWAFKDWRQGQGGCEDLGSAGGPGAAGRGAVLFGMLGP